MAKKKKPAHPSDEAMVAAAKDAYHDEGTLEIDDGAAVSRAEGNPEKGAYVQAWVWVDDEEAS